MLGQDLTFPLLILYAAHAIRGGANRTLQLLFVPRILGLGILIFKLLKFGGTIII